MTSKPLKIELWPIDRIEPYAKNAKIHPDEQIERLAAVIKSQGWDQPIVVDRDGVIIKGHGRRLAALKLGLTEVPVIVRRDLTPAQADAARISDNAVVGLQFDTKVMQDELQRLLGDPANALNVEELGLSKKEQDLLLADLTQPEADALIADTGEAVEAQKEEDTRRVASADDEEVSIATALGFKKVTRAEERLLARGLAIAEATYGVKGKEALLRMFEEAA